MPARILSFLLARAQERSSVAAAVGGLAFLTGYVITPGTEQTVVTAVVALAAAGVALIPGMK